MRFQRSGSAARLRNATAPPDTQASSAALALAGSVGSAAVARGASSPASRSTCPSVRRSSSVSETDATSAGVSPGCGRQASAAEVGAGREGIVEPSRTARRKRRKPGRESFRSSLSRRASSRERSLMVGARSNHLDLPAWSSLTLPMTPSIKARPGWRACSTIVSQAEFGLSWPGSQGAPSSAMLSPKHGGEHEALQWALDRDPMSLTSELGSSTI